MKVRNFSGPANSAPHCIKLLFRPDEKWSYEDMLEVFIIF